MKQANRSLARGLRLIRAFSRYERPTLTELAKAASVPKATALRYLQTLMDERYVAPDPSGKGYALTPRALEIGAGALNSLGVPRQMEPDLERLAVYSGGTAHLGVLDGTDVIIVARKVAPAEQRRFVTMPLFVGSRFPAHCSALGRILLAQAPEQLDEALDEQNIHYSTSATVTDPRAIRDIIEEARSRGYATVVDELAVGYCALGCYLGCHNGINYAVSVSMPSSEYNAETLATEFYPELRKLVWSG